MSCSCCRWKRCTRVASLILCLLGTLLCLCPGITGTVLGCGIGLVALFYGVTRLASFCRCDDPSARFTGDGAFGAALIVFGLFTFFRPAAVASVIPSVIGLCLAVSGIINGQRAFRLRSRACRRWWVAALLAVFLLLLGALCLWGPLTGTASVRFAGLCLLIQALVNGWILSRFCRP